MRNIWVLVLAACSTVRAADEADWWNARWRFRTPVARATPYRDGSDRPVEVAVDFPLLLKQAGIPGEFDPGSLRVVQIQPDGTAREVPFACRTERDARRPREPAYLAWTAQPQVGQIGRFDVYFDTKERGIPPADYAAERLPPQNLLDNPSFEDATDDRPDGWKTSPQELVRLGRFEHTSGKCSLAVIVDEHTPDNAGREAVVSQRIDVRNFAGQEMVFQCDLLAQRAAYGVPVSIELDQFRADGSQIMQYAVEPRWLTLELAQGQLVQLCQRGRFSREAASVEVRIRLRCYVRDADTGRNVTGPESFFTVWLDGLVVRPGERWSWPEKSHAGFVAGALDKAPCNRGFEFTGQRRIAFNGASEGTLTAGRYNPDPNSVHWGLEAGTLEFWCRPTWNSRDGREHIFFEGTAYGHRLQSRLRKLDARGGNRLELTIADAGCTPHTARGAAAFEAGRWHHVAATWDFPAARLQLFFDGKLIASDGPHDRPWPSSLVARGATTRPGIGIMEEDSRSLPMQAFIGGDKACRADTSAQAVLDELRISSTVRYDGPFAPSREEFPVDEDTRALFHFENDVDGLHGGDDRFVDGHLACELPPTVETALLEVFDGGKVNRRTVSVKPHASAEAFEANRAENRLAVTRPFRKLPDPRFIEYRQREVRRVIAAVGDQFTLGVGGDYGPLMRSVTFEHADRSSVRTTLLPRWRANENVVSFSFEDLAATLAPRAKTDAEKALEVFKYALATSNYYDAHICETLPTRHRPRVSYTLIKALNMYAFDQCGPLNYTLRKMFLAAGISSNDASGTHHQFEQAFYDGDYRLFDLSPRVYWLARDNRTVAGRRDFEEDLYLKLRQGSEVTSALPGRVSGARFGAAERPHNMDFLLRPGERVSVCWHNEGRWIEIAEDRRPIPLAKVPPYFGNGAITYEPAAQGEAATLENMLVDQADGAVAVLRAKDPTKPAALIYHAAGPYIFSDARLSGTYQAEREGAVQISLSCDNGKTWTDTWRNTKPAGRIALGLLDRVVGRYGYWLRVRLAPESAASVTNLKVRTTFVVSPLSLPGRLSLGENRIRFVGGPVSAPVQTTCRWVERHRSDLGVSLNAIRYYMNSGESLRNLLVVTPGAPLPIRVTLEGPPEQAEVAVEGLPQGWTASPARQTIDTAGGKGGETAEFLVQPQGAAEGDVHALRIAVRRRSGVRRLTGQVLCAHSPLVREAEQPDETTGSAAPMEVPELSAGAGMRFDGDGQVSFQLAAPEDGTYALWLRARWEPGSSTSMTLRLDRGSPRTLTAAAMIGFTDWTSPARAHTKMFAHFGEQYGHWSWYRIPDVRLTQGRHLLALGATAGARFDAVLLLPQNPTVDRAAMNLLQNWNYAAWDNPL